MSDEMLIPLLCALLVLVVLPDPTIGLLGAGILMGLKAAPGAYS